MKIDFREGLDGIERINRTAIMLIDGACSELRELGYRRSEFEINLQDVVDNEWMSIKMDEKVIYKLVFEYSGSVLVLAGRWESHPKRRGWLSRIWNTIF